MICFRAFLTQLHFGGEYQTRKSRKMTKPKVNDRVKQSTIRHKRRKGFCTKKVTNNQDNDGPEDSINNVNNVPVNIVNTPPLSPVPIIEHTTPPVAVQTVSHKKVKTIVSETPKSTDPVSGYRFMDLQILNSVISDLTCPECKSKKLKLQENVGRKKGLASSLYVFCCECEYKNDFYTSRQQSDTSFDVNKRIVYTMRSCGQGYSGISILCALMDMPKPMTANNYDKLAKRFANVTQEVAEETMNDCADEIRSNAPESNDDDIVDTAISHDGTWQRRGYASLSGCTAAISMDTGKILDVEPMSRFCKACTLKEKLKQTDPAKYDLWKVNHTCSYNYTGSANGMEVEGAKRIFHRSVEKRKLRYSTLYGDLYSKAHVAVENIYPNKPVQKLQCIGHVQKRVGCRLLKLKKNVKGLGGPGRLTNVVVNRLQNYYGIAVRSNVGNLEKMQKATRATLFHVASSSKNSYHSAYCPPGKDSWCRFQRDEAEGTSTYKPGKGLPLDIIKHVKPIFTSLSSNELLSGCLHGRTQNQNESFNGTIWDRLPKSKYSGLMQLRFGVYDAVANFNIGRKASVLTFEKMGMIPGKYMLRGLFKINKRRLYHSTYQNKDGSKKQRKIIRGAKKLKADKDKEKEGTLYKAGEFG